MRKAFFLLILVASFVLSACVPGVPSDKPVSSKEFLKGAVVKGFPQTPLVKGAQVLESYSNKGNFGASFISDESLSKVINFYSF